MWILVRGRINRDWTKQTNIYIYIYIYIDTHKEGGDGDEGMWQVEGDGMAYFGKMKSLKRLDIWKVFFFLRERDS